MLNQVSIYTALKTAFGCKLQVTENLYNIGKKYLKSLFRFLFCYYF